MHERECDTYPVLLAGGSGTRLWPVSRELYPKQLVSFIGRDSLVQSTIKRMDAVLDRENVRIVCGSEHLHEIARHVEEIGVSAAGKIICEPCGRNTAPAILLSVLTILKHADDAVICVFPADHVIRDISIFHDRLSEAVRLAAAGHIVTFGIRPGYAETGYGYIEGGTRVPKGALKIRRFVEKPDRATAEAYIRAGNFFWNSGMFAFRASVILEEFRAHQPALLRQMETFVSGENSAPGAYASLPNISIDYAVMEKTRRGVVLPSDFGWSDIGSWKSLYDFLPKDSHQNVIDGDVIARDTESSFIMGHDRLIATNRLRHMVVVDTPDSVFVSDIDNSRDVKAIVAELKQKGRVEYQTHRTVYYAWGSMTVLLRKDGFQVDRMIVYPKAALEMAPDAFALRHLVVVEGLLRVAGDGVTQLLRKGESVTIGANRGCRLENQDPDPVSIIQVQTMTGAE